MRTRDDRGAAALELGLVIPVLLTLVLGIVDFGFAFNAKISVTQAAREGARVIAVNDSTVTAQTRVGQAMADGGTATSVTTTILSRCTNSTTASVQVTATSPTILPIPDLTVTGRGVMRCED